MKIAPAFKVITSCGGKETETDYRLVLCGDILLHYLAAELHPKRAQELEREIVANKGYHMTFECVQLVQKTIAAQATRVAIDFRIGEIKPRFSIFTFQWNDESINYLKCFKHLYRDFGLCKMTISLGEFGTDKKEMEINMKDDAKSWELFQYNMDQMGASPVIIPNSWAGNYQKFKKGSFHIVVNWSRMLGLEAPTVTQDLLNPNAMSEYGSAPLITSLPRTMPAEVEFKWPLDESRKAMTVHCLNVIERHVRIDPSRAFVTIAPI